jgi:hypothetical protein
MTLTRTLTELTTAVSIVRPRAEPTRTSRDIPNPDTDRTAKAHDYILFKLLMDSLTDLAQSRLIGIISNRKRLVEALPGKINSIRAHSATEISHTHVVKQQETATHTHDPHNTGPGEHRHHLEVESAGRGSLAPGFLTFRTPAPIGLHTPCGPDVL